MRFQAKIQGLASVIKKIEAYDKKLGEGVSIELRTAVDNAATTARSLAPTGATNLLRSSIGSNEIDKYNKSFFANAPYAAYVEFGTGSMVFKAKSGFMFTPEMREFAKEFYVNGKGRQPATPFMFPALEQEKVKVIGRIKK